MPTTPTLFQPAAVGLLTGRDAAEYAEYQAQITDRMDQVTAAADAFGERPSTPAEVLRRAADVIDAVGWCQGAMVTPDLRVCAEGAMHAAVGAVPFRAASPLYYRTLVALCAMVETDRPISVPYWNDHAATTAELVTKTMRTVADQLDAEGTR